MASLFDSYDEGQFGGDLPGASSITPEMETFTETRIEPRQQLAADVRQPRSIMDRMRELAQSFIEPNPQTGMSGMEIFGATLQDVGSAIDRRPGGALQGLRTSRATEMNQRGQRGIELMRLQQGQQKEARESRKQELKEKAYEEIANLSMEPKNLEPDNLWKLAAPLIKAGDNDAGLGLLKLGIQARQSDKVRGELTQLQTQLALAKTPEDADAILGSMSPELMKEHGSFFMQLVKRRFPDENKGEKSLNTNDLIAFVESKGRLRGPTVPKDMTPEEAKRVVASQRSMQQQQINVTTGQNVFRNADALRDEFNNQTKVYKDQRVEFEKLEKLSKMKTPASDISFIVQAAKADDPTSTVRETEASIRENARSFPEGMKVAVQRFLTGQKLTDKQRRELVDVAKVAYNANRRSYETTRKTYTELSGQSGVDPKRVVGEELPSMVRKKAGEATPTGNRVRVDAQGNIIK